METKRKLLVAPFEASKTKVKALFGIALTGRQDGINFSIVAPDEKQAEIIWKKLGMGTYDAYGLQQVVILSRDMFTETERL